MSYDLGKTLRARSNFSFLPFFADLPLDLDPSYRSSPIGHTKLKDLVKSRVGNAGTFDFIFHVIASYKGTMNRLSCPKERIELRT